ncbi:unnamed protein product [Oncorhynchus mykiss]|uniref:Protein kinase domain-containing protein n=1 Tax=Oncorhynchus mykiss TaxID=8022 RepID=A0A060W708_ONCMY|nr:unnamed protein product [Oncorhynchus mykiss]
MVVDHCPFSIKLIDFGSASIFSEVHFVNPIQVEPMFYRSPEILLGLPFCEKVDMWSLGCVMSELFLGWPLYPGYSYVPPPSGTEGRTLGKQQGSTDRRKYILSSLDQMETMEFTEHDPELRNEDVTAEVVNRRSMVQLLKQMLTLDAHQRILPNAALHHPFISMHHLLHNSMANLLV